MPSLEKYGIRDTALAERQALYNSWDAEFSARRREYGKDVPAQNADLIVHSQGLEASESSYLEYDHFEIKAIGEYKRNTWAMPSLYKQEAWARILVSLAKPHQVPAFLAIYSPEHWWYRCYPLNSYAEQYFGSNGELLTERGFVSKLYAMRNRTAPNEILLRLNDYKPDENPIAKKPKVPPTPTRVTAATDVQLVNRRLYRETKLNPGKYRK